MHPATTGQSGQGWCADSEEHLAARHWAEHLAARHLEYYGPCGKWCDDANNWCTLSNCGCECRTCWIRPTPGADIDADDKEAAPGWPQGDESSWELLGEGQRWSRWASIPSLRVLCYLAKHRSLCNSLLQHIVEFAWGSVAQWEFIEACKAANVDRMASMLWLGPPGLANASDLWVSCPSKRT